LQHSLEEHEIRINERRSHKNRHFMHDPITKGRGKHHGRETNQTPPQRTENK